MEISTKSPIRDTAKLVPADIPETNGDIPMGSQRFRYCTVQPAQISIRNMHHIYCLHQGVTKTYITVARSAIFS